MTRTDQQIRDDTAPGIAVLLHDDDLMGTDNAARVVNAISELALERVGLRAYVAQLEAALSRVGDSTSEQEEPTWLTTDCWHCDDIRAAKLPWPDGLQRRMIVCPECGNKRCPKATHHDNACTGSNAPGQPGSRYVVAEYSRVIRRPPAGTSGQED